MLHYFRTVSPVAFLQILMPASKSAAQHESCQRCALEVLLDLIQQLK